MVLVVLRVGGEEERRYVVYLFREEDFVSA